MARLNKRQNLSDFSKHPDATKNYENGLAFKMDSHMELYSRVATSLLGEPKFYKEVDENGTIVAENQDGPLLNAIHKMALEDPKFVLQLAVYARQQMYLRTTPLMMLVEASLMQPCKQFVRAAAPKIILRADEPCEDIAYLISKVGQIGSQGKGSIPRQLKLGIAESLTRFGAYHFAKYDRKDRAVKQRDMLCLIHPKPANEERSALYKSLLEGSIASPDTWEVLISTKGSNKETWTQAAKIMPYMALLRNLRNLLNNDVDLKETETLSKISDPEQVRKSKQLPFRFFSAYREIESNTTNHRAAKVMDALEAAMDASLDNLPRFGGVTYIASDDSGSMNGTLSAKSKVRYFDVGALFLAISHRLCEEAITGQFSDQHRVVNLSSRNGVLSNMRSLRNTGGGTYGGLTVDYLLRHQLMVDRIIVFSDMQMYGDRDLGEEYSFVAMLNKYRRTINPDVMCYLVDLAGYGTSQVSFKDDGKSCLIAGFSERILEFIKVFEEDKSTAVDAIKLIELTRNVKQQGKHDTEEEE